MNKDTLKKHHFWILLGLAPLMVLIAVVLLTSGVGAAIDEKKAKITEANTALKSKTSVKPNALLAKIDAQIAQLGEKRTDLWKENWERQIGVGVRKDASGKEVLTQDPARNLLRWPKSRLLAKFDYTTEYATDPNQKKFGEEIMAQKDDNGEYDEFRKQEVYLAEYSNARPGATGTGMADQLAPTTFDGGWERVLRHVRGGEAGWGQGRPTSEQLWLALEDIWVQRAMLAAVKSVNDQISTFARTQRYDDNGKAVEDTPLERTFLSRLWRVNLKVAPRQADGRYVITGTLSNVTDQLQLLGTGGGMTLNVWLTNDVNAKPFSYRIGGESLAGQASMPVLQTDDHVLPNGIVPTEIARVEQVFDTRTIPVRRIDRVALGKTDSRYAGKPTLEMPKFKVYEAEAAAATADPSGGAGPGGTGLSVPGGVGPGPGPGSASGPPGGKAFPGGGPGGAAGGAGAAQMEGGGDVSSVLDGNKRRYVEVTTQVRRMPVAISMVVDQNYVQDVLLAYSNSPFRFQITQVHWQRFRGTLGTAGPGGPGSSSSGEDVVGSARGSQGKGFEYGGSGGGPLPGLPPIRPGFGPGPGGPGMMGSSGGPPGPGGSLTTISDAQLTAGLVELTVYGIVSLYEKYQAPTTAPTN